MVKKHFFYQAFGLYYMQKRQSIEVRNSLGNGRCVRIDFTALTKATIRSFKMLNRLMGATMVFIAALVLSPIAFAQNGQRGPQRGAAGTASSKTFDPHDLSGFWDITNNGLPRGAL